MSGSNGLFLLSTTGQIETGEFPGFDNIYCKYCYSYGLDWVVTAVSEINAIQHVVFLLVLHGIYKTVPYIIPQGLEEGISQVGKCSNDERRVFVWNFPLEITFKSTNPFGCK